MLTVCLGGMYGSNCRVTCGNCFESKQCHYINGTCMNGCDNGYQGFQCNKGLDIESRSDVHVLLAVY